MNSEIKMVALSAIKSNPFRQHSKYPYNPDKIAALRRSIADVGLWEGVIGRKAKDGGYELSFGHHRVEAAKKELGSDAKVALIVRDLDDKQMIQFFGRENLEDYNAAFPVMLESWEGGRRFLSRDTAKNPEDIDIARLLGWTRWDEKGKNEDRINDVATACAKASRLIKGGYLDHDDLKGLAVHSVRHLVDRMISQHEMTERMAKKTNRPAREVERVKQAVSRAGKFVANKIRSGDVAPKAIAGHLDVESFRAGAKVKDTPLFKAFASRLLDTLAALGKDDAIGERFAEIKKALPSLAMQEDVEIVEMIGVACGQVSARFTKWQTAFTEPKTKVIKLREIGHER